MPRLSSVLCLVAFAGSSVCACAQSPADIELDNGVIRGDSARVERALRNGADPNIPYGAIDTNPALLHVAVERGQLAIVRSLLSAGADPNDGTGWQGSQPLHQAPDSLTVSLLVDAGAEVDGRSRTGETPLFNAAKYGHVSVVRELLRLGADPNSRDIGGLTPLHETSDIGVAKLLVAAGADINARHNGGLTPLDSYVQRNEYVHLPLPPDAPDDDLKEEAVRLQSGKEYIRAMRGLGALHSREL